MKLLELLQCSYFQIFGLILCQNLSLGAFLNLFLNCVLISGVHKYISQFVPVSQRCGIKAEFIQSQVWLTCREKRGLLCLWSLGDKQGCSTDVLMSAMLKGIVQAIEVGLYEVPIKVSMLPTGDVSVGPRHESLSILSYWVIYLIMAKHQTIHNPSFVIRRTFVSVIYCLITWFAELRPAQELMNCSTNIMPAKKYNLWVPNSAGEVTQELEKVTFTSKFF